MEMKIFAQMQNCRSLVLEVRSELVFQTLSTNETSFLLDR